MGIMFSYIKNLPLILRKNKIFNKSRYSRNRQTTRVAFYLSIIINLLVVFGVFNLYYKINFKATYFWWLFFIFFLSFFFSSFLRNTPAFSTKKFISWLNSLIFEKYDKFFKNPFHAPDSIYFKVHYISRTWWGVWSDMPDLWGPKLQDREDVEEHFGLIMFWDQSGQNYTRKNNPAFSS